MQRSGRKACTRSRGCRAGYHGTCFTSAGRAAQRSRKANPASAPRATRIKAAAPNRGDRRQRQPVKIRATTPPSHNFHLKSTRPPPSTRSPSLGDHLRRSAAAVASLATHNGVNSRKGGSLDGVAPDGPVREGAHGGCGWGSRGTGQKDELPQTAAASAAPALHGVRDDHRAGGGRRRLLHGQPCGRACLPQART